MVVVILIGILGAIFGSFSGAQIWRLRARQLIEDQKAGEKVDAKELGRLKLLGGKKGARDRSRCLSCGHVLAWYDLVPFFSWICLLGKCRYCGRFIGWTEIVLEIGLAVLFALSLIFWPYPLASILHILLLIIWLAALVLLSILFVYDLKWFILPDIITIPFIILGLVFAAIQLILSRSLVADAVSLVTAICILSGLYLLLYMYSKMRFGEDKTWVGFGDIKLGLGLALFVGHWLLAFAVLFAANLLGTLLVLPSMLRGKLDAGSRIPFGPLLITGFVLVWLAREQVLSWFQYIS